MGYSSDQTRYLVCTFGPPVLQRIACKTTVLARAGFGVLGYDSCSAALDEELLVKVHHLGSRLIAGNRRASARKLW